MEREALLQPGRVLVNVRCHPQGRSRTQGALRIGKFKYSQFSLISASVEAGYNPYNERVLGPLLKQHGMIREHTKCACLGRAPTIQPGLTLQYLMFIDPDHGKWTEYPDYQALQHLLRVICHPKRH